MNHLVTLLSFFTKISTKTSLIFAVRYIFKYQFLYLKILLKDIGHFQDFQGDLQQCFLHLNSICIFVDIVMQI